MNFNIQGVVDSPLEKFMQVIKGVKKKMSLAQNLKRLKEAVLFSVYSIVLMGTTNREKDSLLGRSVLEK